MIIKRRQLLRSGATLGAGLAASSMVKPALAATRITAVEWGGGVIDAMKRIAAAQDKVTLDWVLFAGGAGSILPKIKASWPKPDYDYTAGWEGSFGGMIKEDWLVPVTVETVPNLADIPQSIIVKNQKGEWMAVPRAVGGIYFAYRADISPIEVKSIDDLFDPRLKGKICWPGPSQTMGLNLVALALHAGGNEFNTEPGWKLTKELAKSGNIGRVGNTDTDFSASLSSGETAVGFFAEPMLTEVGKNFPLVRLTKQKGMPTFLYQSGFAVLRNRADTAATLGFINHAISPEMSSLYAEIAGEAPLNQKSKVPAAMKHLVFTQDEMKAFVYLPDFQQVLSQQDAWAKRWEDDIAPLL